MNDVIVAYVPVLHAGYLGFFRNYPGCDIILVDPSMVSEVEYITRDMRALPLSVMHRILSSTLDVFGEVPRNVFVGDGTLLRNIALEKRIVVFPDEDVSRAIATKYFDESQCVFAPVFLRWDWGSVTKSKTVLADRVVSVPQAIEEVMGYAYEVAQRSSDWWRQVGAILVRHEVPLVVGWNTHFPHPHTPYILGDPRTPFAPGVRIDLSLAHHAEKQIIARAARLGIATQGADLVVTTFPCPGCAMDIVEAGIRRVYFSEGYSLLEADEILRSRNVEIVQISPPPR